MDTLRGFEDRMAELDTAASRLIQTGAGEASLLNERKRLMTERYEKVTQQPLYFVHRFARARACLFVHELWHNLGPSAACIRLVYFHLYLIICFFRKNPAINKWKLT